MEMSEDSYDTLSKVIVLGNSGVGKTSILLRLCESTFTDNYISTIGMDFKVKVLEGLGGKRIKLQIWDTAGQERYRVLTKTFYKGASGIVLVYSVDDEASFLDISKWMKQIEESAGPELQLLILGNKCDLEKSRVVSREQGDEVSRKYKAKFQEVSAKSSVNVNEAFASLAKDLKPKGEDRMNHGSVSLSTASSKANDSSKSRCCGR